MKKTYAAVLISPSGEEWFVTYGPDSKNIEDAVPYVSKKAAEGGALERMGRAGSAFWESERRTEKAAEQTYRGWTFRIDTVLTPNVDPANAIAAAREVLKEWVNDPAICVVVGLPAPVDKYCDCWVCERTRNTVAALALLEGVQP